MHDSATVFTIGDWIVHRQYGIGQIIKRETRTISGQTNEYFKVDTPDSTIWLPVSKLDTAWFRPIATPIEFQHALTIMSQPPLQMESNFISRKERILRVQTENSIESIARLIRDLWARQQQKSLSITEQRALKRLKERFVTEWSVSSKIEQELARHQLQRLLERNESVPLH